MMENGDTSGSGSSRQGSGGKRGGKSSKNNWNENQKVRHSSQASNGGSGEKRPPNFYINEGSVIIKAQGQSWIKKKCQASGTEDGFLVDVKECRYGFIRPAMGTINIYFQVAHVYNSTEQEIALEIGMPIKYIISNQNDRGNKSERAYQVFVGENSVIKNEAEVIDVQDQNVILEGAITVHLQKLPKYLLPPNIGDTISYVLALASGTPSARSANVVKFASRNDNDIFHFFDNTVRILETSAASQVLTEVLTSSALWEVIGNHKTASTRQQYFFNVCNFLQQIFRKNKGHENKIIHAMTILTETKLFAEVQQMPSLRIAFSAPNLDQIGDFFRSVLKLCPHLFIKMNSVVDWILGSFRLSPHEKKFIQNLVHELGSVGDMNSGPSSSGWKDISTIPRENEILGNLMVSENTLPVVKANAPYLTTGDYLDTNFRLLRAELYSAIQRGIQDYKNGCLDTRDMHCYNEVSLVGYYFTHSQMCLAVQFTPSRPVKNWATSPQLMYGNLLCISPTGKFDELIWATVAERDETQLNKSRIIMISLCKENSLSLTEVYDRLVVCGGRAVMVESPTCFNALHPVLSSLQEFDFETFSLNRAIVHAEVPENFPMPVDPEVIAIAKGLDESQRNAFFHCLTNKVAIIQGPPGTGKTFIGVKCVEALFKMCRGAPIVIMTYKNHALDEFLKHILKKGIVTADEVIRMGGRSKEEELNKCNLNERAKMIKSYGGEIYDARQKVDTLKVNVKSLAGQLDRASGLTAEDLLQLLSEEQLLSILETRFTRNHKMWTQTVPKMKGSHVDLAELVRRVPNEDETNQSETDFVQEILKALKAWLPSKKTLLELRKFQAKMMQKKVIDGDDIANSGVNDDDDFDEDYIRQIQELRLSALHKSAESKDKIKDNLIMLRADDMNSPRFKVSDFPEGIHPDESIGHTANIGALGKDDEIDKLKFILSKILEHRIPLLKEFEREVGQLEIAMEEKKKIEDERKLQVLRQSKIVAMTISGAAIFKTLLAKLEPQTLIVEEAAEILEPSLLTSITQKTEHLIMIGDHKQLRPGVDTYELVNKCHFDVSMMERLINCGYPFKTLKKQNRMRPEFSLLLRDIYPDLEDNLDLVMNNQPLDFLNKSMFFWTHNHPEDTSRKDQPSRSKSNTMEAKMVLALSLFFLGQGCLPEDITILVAYLGQSKIIRKDLRETKVKYPSLFGPNDGMISVQTIDMYQGDENKYVIVSLVRSGVEKIGFLNTLNRRCVAQSRAKCGLYFVGNVNTITTSAQGKRLLKTVWGPMVKGMTEKGCVGTAIDVHCPIHRSLSSHSVKTAMEFAGFIANPGSFCPITCGRAMPCNVHHCENKCFPKHKHDKCERMVDDIFLLCGHPIRRRCWEDLNTISCQKRIEFVRQNCGHIGHKKCYVDASKLVCEDPCKLTMNCGLHPCPKKCGEPHLHTGCREIVPFTFPICQHNGFKKCFELAAAKKCKAEVKIKLQKCGHEWIKECYQNESEAVCDHPCSSKNDCRKHQCKEKCGQPHSHQVCHEKVDYNFPACNHPSPHKKKCSEPIIWKCKSLVNQMHPKCSHSVRKECSEDFLSVKCQFAPCPRTRSCSHPCTNVCGDDCDKGDCLVCNAAHKQEMEKFRDSASRQIRALQRAILNDPRSCYKITELHKDDAAYMDVYDKVIKYIQPVHNWYPIINKVESVINLRLEKDFEEAKLDAFGTLVTQKFHGTGKDGVENIPKTGFRMPGPPPPGKPPGMYGQGIYFASDSSKSAQEIYTKGSYTLLLCDVLLGKAKTVTGANPTLNKEKLKKERYDSVYAKRDTKGSGGVLNDEYVVFDPRQAIVRYIIHYSVGGTSVLANLKTLEDLARNAGQQFLLKKLTPSRRFNVDDPFEQRYRIAEAHFKRMIRGAGREIESIDIVFNKTLEDLFQAKKAEFERNKVDSKEVLAFHGTPTSSIESILKTNLQMKYASGQAYGRGLYFSEFPDISIPYGRGTDGLLLFRVLPGNESLQAHKKPPGYHSIKIGGNVEGFGDMLIIEDNHQFVPYAVYHLKRKNL